jgi:hypothetical protein
VFVNSVLESYWEFSDMIEFGTVHEIVIHSVSRLHLRLNLH